MQELMHLALIWFSVFIAILLAKKTRLTPVLWFLFIGAALVNIGLLPLEPSEFIHGFSELGIIVIMFALGFEENSSQFIKSAKRSWGIALFGAIAPFTVAYFAALSFWGDSNIALMCGLAMTATAVSLTMVSLRTEGLHTSTAATGIMTSAVIDDVASLILVALLIPYVTGEGALDATGITLILLKAVLFFVAITVLAAWIFPHNITKGFISKIPFIKTYGIGHILLSESGERSTLVLLLLAVMSGIMAIWFGFHPAVGAYMAGLIIKEEYFHFSDPVDSTVFERSRKIIDDMAFTVIGPIFFVVLGTTLIFDAELFVSILDEVLILFFGLFFAQIISATLAARYTGKFEWNASVMIGIGMLGRAELAFVVMNIAYIQNKILTEEAFYTLMIVCFLLNIAVPICIRWWAPVYAGDKTNPFSRIKRSQ